MKLFNVTWSTETAGPSPDGLRTEIFLFGCNKAKNGNPCKGCFNSAIWDDSKAIKSYTPQEIADKIEEYAPNKYVTIGGGEPSDQLEELIELCKLLKEKGFHIMVYTWKSLIKVLNPHTVLTHSKNGIKQNQLYDIEYYKFKQLFKFIDILVDGEFKLEEKLYKENANDGTFNSIGSGNQIIWDIKELNKNNILKGFKLKDIIHLYIKLYNNNLIYVLKDNIKEETICLN